MHTDHKVQITVLIADRPYLLRINPADEALVHQLARDINDQIKAFKAAYPGRDLQDCLALTLLTFAADRQRAAQAA
jgi:cell division protein ZapA (FtsZ GTPase activity inhibitor)